MTLLKKKKFKSAEEGGKEDSENSRKNPLS